MTCRVCEACATGSDESLRGLVRYQAVMLDRARAALLPTQVELGRARDRISALEEIVNRQNRRLNRGRQAG